MPGPAGNHPYMFPEAVPDTEEVGEDVVHTSGKMRCLPPAGGLQISLQRYWEAVAQLARLAGCRRHTALDLFFLTEAALATTTPYLIPPPPMPTMHTVAHQRGIAVHVRNGHRHCVPGGGGWCC